MSHVTRYKIVMLGDGGVGKTALTMQFVLDHFPEYYHPTIEESYHKDIEVNGTLCRLDVLDTTGEEDYSMFRKQAMTAGDGFILVYSICSRESFDRILKLHDEVHQVSTQEGQALAMSLKCEFFETSAKTGENVQDAFTRVTLDVRRQPSQGPPHQIDAIPKLGTVPRTTGNELPSGLEEEKQYRRSEEHRQRRRRSPCVVL